MPTTAMNQNRQSGQSLIEVLIVILVAGMVLTGLAAVMANSVKSTSEARYREVGTAKSQRALDYFRREKARLGWLAFKNEVNPGEVYCFRDTFNYSNGLDAILPSGACGTYETDVATGTGFKTEARIEETTSQITITVTGTWESDGRTRDVKLVTILSETI